jgi:Mn-dependent DtxR family transcriptional regulator
MGISVKTLHYFLMFLLSITVVASLSAAGVILVVAMLITPAATALLLSDKLKHVLFLAAGIGLLTTVIGFFLTLLLDTTPGPAMCLVATFLYGLAMLFSPSKGLIKKYITRFRENNRILQEDVLRLLDKGKAQAFTTHTIADKLEHSTIRIKKILTTMRQSKLVENLAGDVYTLTAVGREQAIRMQRAHRLWETYQNRTMGIDPDLVHNEADLLEHHLNDEFLHEVDRHLGFPETDPHGSPIPRK